MNTTQAAPARLTRLIVRQHTAFGTAEEMRAAMTSGYLPTVHRVRQAALLAALNAEGFRAFVIG